MVWHYVFEDGELAAAGAMDFHLAAVLATSLGLLPVGRVLQAIATESSGVRPRREPARGGQHPRRPLHADDRRAHPPGWRVLVRFGRQRSGDRDGAACLPYPTSRCPGLRRGVRRGLACRCCRRGASPVPRPASDPAAPPGRTALRSSPTATCRYRESHNGSPATDGRVKLHGGIRWASPSTPTSRPSRPTRT